MYLTPFIGTLKLLFVKTETDYIYIYPSVLHEISQLLNTGLDRETLSICASLCETGVDPEALATVVLEMQKQCTTEKDNN